jgi:galactose-1-phosphate uridylyltransferase
MAELRRDPITGRWVIIEIDKAKNPSVILPKNIRKGRYLSFLRGTSA